MLATTANERSLVAAIRRGDQEAFVTLVERHHASMLRVARMFVRTTAVAEDVVQETWLAVIQGIDRFEGRSSLKSWLFRILTNRAKTRGVREARMVPFSSTVSGHEDEAAVDPDRFGTDGSWHSLPAAAPTDEQVVSKEIRKAVETCIAKLPPQQQLVITLRDVEGVEADEVCELLGLSESNQRVLLHRARSKVRAALEPYLEDAS